ncbi:MAG: hypothetical protein JW795_22070 [Chitinivibrionales bacterium]|nr:hypothetical protein [Chitinivibrionales bacterium]
MICKNFIVVFSFLSVFFFSCERYVSDPVSPKHERNDIPPISWISVWVTQADQTIRLSQGESIEAPFVWIGGLGLAITTAGGGVYPDDQTWHIGHLNVPWRLEMKNDKPAWINYEIMNNLKAYDIGTGKNTPSTWVIGDISDLGSPLGANIYKFDDAAKGWIAVQGLGTRITVDEDGKPWHINSDGYIYTLNSRNKWVCINFDQSAIDIAAGRSYETYGVYIVTSSGILKALDPSTMSWHEITEFSNLNKQAYRVACCGSTAAVVTTSGELYIIAPGSFVYKEPIADVTDVGFNIVYIGHKK